MDQLDLRILDKLQNDFPLSAKPYEAIANKLEIPVDELWAKIERMVSEKVIRRIGASLNSHKIGFQSTLAAVSVDSNLVKKAAEVIGKFHEVTHSYLRKDKFNVWFTIIAPDNNRIEDILEQIRSCLDIDDSQVLNLPMKRLFKLDTRFNVLGKSQN